MLNFNFLGLDFDILEYLENNADTKNMYVFKNSNDAVKIRKMNQSKFVKYAVISESEFWEKYLLTDKIILKEEKETIFYYNNLTEKQKKKQKINGYFDCIDKAYKYYSFMKEYLQHGLDIEKMSDLQPWQKEKIEDYLEIHENIKKNVKNKIPRYLLSEYSYINQSLVNKYENIIFIDKFSYTKLELEMIKNIPNHKIFLSVDKKDYNTKKLRLEGISYEDKIKANFRVIECKDSFSQLIKLIDIVDTKEGNTVFYDNNYEDLGKIKEYNSLLNQNEILHNEGFSLNQTENYNIISKIFEILKNRQDHRYKISDVYNLYNNVYFREIFNIEKKDVNKLLEEAKNNKYIYSKTLESLNFIDEMLEYKNQDDFMPILNKIVEFRSNKDGAFDVSYALSEALNETNNLDLSVLSDFPKEYLEILLKYLDAKKMFMSKIKAKCVINNISGLSSLKNDEVNILNLNYPLKNTSNSIFTRAQREQFGLSTKMNSNFEKLHLYYSRFAKSKNVLIMYIKNEDENVSELPFITDLIYTLKLDVEKFEVSLIQRANLLESLFDKENIVKSQFKGEYPLKNDILDKISVTQLLKLRNSQLYYYMSKKIKEIPDMTNDRTGLNIYGNILHEIMQNLIEKHKSNIFDITKKDIEDEIEKQRFNISMKILKKYENEFNIYFLNDLSDNVLKFLNFMKKQLKNEKIVKVETEIEMSRNIYLPELDKNVKLFGISDLVIETSESIFVVDYKTTTNISDSKVREHFEQAFLYSEMDRVYETGKKLNLVIAYIVEGKNDKKDHDEAEGLSHEEIATILTEYMSDKVTDRYLLGKKDNFSKFGGVVENYEKNNNKG